MQGLGCCPLHWTEPDPAAAADRCSAAASSSGGSRSAGNGFSPLLTDGAGITKPGFTAWSQRPPGAGQFRIWLGSPYQGLVPSGSYGLAAAALPRRRRALARDVDARQVARAAHDVGLEILRDPAVDPSGSGSMLVSAGARHSRRREEPGQTRRRLVDRQREVQRSHRLVVRRDSPARSTRPAAGSPASVRCPVVALEHVDARSRGWPASAATTRGRR